MDFPAPEPNDNEEVAWAIQTAHVMWKRGDGEDAIRWLQRGAAAAENAGDDMRLLVLARAAAEFSGARPKPSRPATADPTATPNPAEPRLPRQQTVIGLGSPKSAPLASTQSAPPPPSRRAQPPPLDRVALASSRPSSASIPDSASLPDAEVTNVYASAEADALREAASSSASSAPVHVPPAKPGSATSTPVTTPGREAASRQSLTPLPTVAVGPRELPKARRSLTHHATRVSVTPSNTPGALSVRPLAEGERLQPGAREALLVPLHAGEDLFG